MRNLRLISTTAAILLLGAGAVSAQSIKTDEMPTAAPAAQQNAPAEKVAPALKSSQSKVPETTGQIAPTSPEADKKQLKSQTMDKAPAAAAAKGSSDANSDANVKNKSSADKSGAGAASPSGKSADQGKRNTTGQGSVDEGAVGGSNPARHRHYHHYRHCWFNILGNRNCWR
jgi:cytoskeletal protein RodZ